MIENFSWLIILLGAVIVVGVTEFIKSIDKKDKIKKYYFIFPIGMSFVSGLITTFVGIGVFNVWMFLLNALVIFGFSVIGYESILKLVQKHIDKVSVDIEQKKKQEPPSEYF